MMPWELEHILRAASEATGSKKFIVVGSQAIIGSYTKGIEVKDLPKTLWQSEEADLIPEPEDLWPILETELGENSLFAKTHGYFADGVQRSSVVLPPGWELRTIPFSSPHTNGTTGYCLEPHDLLVSKYCAGRAKDREFCQEVIRLGLIDKSVLLERLQSTYANESIKEISTYLIEDHFKQAIDLLDFDEGFRAKPR